MQGKLIFLLEELSMKTLLDNLLPRLFTQHNRSRSFQVFVQGVSSLARRCVAHENIDHHDHV